MPRKPKPRKRPAAGERFLRVFMDLWLDAEEIRGRGDAGRAEGGITLAQEAVYFRLCLP